LPRWRRSIESVEEVTIVKLAFFQAEVDAKKCVGDKLCERICPTGAAKVVNKKAIVEGEKCVACTRCHDRCLQDAITIAPRPEPRRFGTSVADVDEAELRELCLKAHRLPGELVCVCTLTPAQEIAAAIIKGARSIREVCLMTGTMTGCQEFCVPVIQRMLKASGVNIAKAGEPLRYEQTFSMWDLPEELQRKYPGYYFEEDIKLATKLRKG
jgi:Fe-S-cluster-containing hydrogenase component 2